VHKNEYDYGRNISIIVKTESSLWKLFLALTIKISLKK
jgi:hypothetical protein